MNTDNWQVWVFKDDSEPEYKGTWGSFKSQLSGGLDFVESESLTTVMVYDGWNATKVRELINQLERMPL